MNHDEVAFFNEQLAGMLRSGIPLEGSIRKLCERMRRGEFRSEMQALERDLAKGTPLDRALEARRLPETYVRLLKMGARTGNLPDVLRMTADYYRRTGATWARLKGLMVYPAIVLALSTLLSIFIAWFVARPWVDPRDYDAMGLQQMPATELAMRYLVLAPPVILLLAGGLLIALCCMPRVRGLARWKIPPFREGSLAQSAAALALAVRSGATLSEASEFAAAMEEGTPAETELHAIAERLSEGVPRFPEAARGSRIFPELFLWMVEGAGEDAASGFERASGIYASRAEHRTDILLYAALPVSVLLLGIIILSQLAPLFMLFVRVWRGVLWWG